MYPLVKELADDEIPVTVTWRVLNIARRSDSEFGHRFLADEARLGGYLVCDRTVWKICSENGWHFSAEARTGSSATLSMTT